MAQTVIQNLLTGDVLIALVIGTVAGIIIGALPGMGANLATSLLLPITFTMKPVAGLVMLTAVYTSTVYGGSITAVLLHTPGTASSAATAIDGFELTKQGRGMTAVGAATIGSMIGGAFSAVALLFLARPLADVSLKFGPLEFFLVGLFGLTIISSLSGKSPVKGLLAATLGLLLGVIGLDPDYSTPRFTFGNLYLQDGLTSAAVLMGLFSVSQVLINVEKIAKKQSTIVDDPKKALRGSIWPTKQEMKDSAKTIARSSVLGVIIGIIPAAGASIGSWIGYNQAKKGSRHPELFGKGSVEGVFASETTNNAVTGGALIPMMALGIPGSGSTAIIMGGFLIHGLNTGYSMFQKTGDYAYAIIIGFFFANILMGILGLLFARYAAMLAVVPMNLLLPMIIAVASMGAFAVKGRTVDVIVMLISGILGYFMRKTGFELPPLVLGLILSEIIENNIRRAQVLAKGDLPGYFFTRPIAILLAVLVAGTLVWPVLKDKALPKRKASAAADVQAERPEE